MASSKTRSRNRPVPAGRPAEARGSSSRSGTSRASAGASKAQQRRQAAVEPVEETPAGPPTWLKIATFVLALAGLGVSIYLTYAHYTASSLAGCNEKAGIVNCGEVTTSSQSMIFGVIPVAVTGLAFYVFMVAILSPWSWNSRWAWMPKLRLAAAIAGIGMVLYLVYAELFQIGAICLYCTSVHIITFLIFALVAVSSALWGLAPAPRRAAAAVLPSAMDGPPLGL
ncbi:MAG: vitamin K epoxide reductase family protein [Streptosporangiaceae bacterium]|jgi:uncharacterized membrane protein